MARRRKSYPNQQRGQKLQGTDEVMRNLKKEFEKIKGLSMKGLITAAKLIRRDMDTTPPLIPVDTGNMRASIYIVSGTGTMDSRGLFVGKDAPRLSSDHNSEMSQVSGKISRKLIVAIGVSAYYAPIVERDTFSKRKRPGSGGGFFESSIINNKDKIVDIVKMHAKVK